MKSSPITSLHPTFLTKNSVEKRNSFRVALLVFFFFSIAAFTKLFAQEELMYTDHVYRESIKTPMLYLTGNPLSSPYLELNSGMSLTMRFDDMDADYKDLYYKVIHCNANWEPSDLDEGDYLSGFYSHSITEYEQSFNTFIDYTHYQLQFPNDLGSIRLSGNYVLMVYEDDDPEQLVLSRRFVVFENLIRMGAEVNPATRVAESKYMQEVDVLVNDNGFDIVDPYSAFNLTILQNNRWDNAIKNLNPRFVKSNTLDFDLTEENNFLGHNEFREFDIKDMDYVSMQVEFNGIKDREWHSFLKEDPRRAFKIYRSVRDINGKYLIKNDDAFESFTEEDYVWVHFSLPFDTNLNDNEIYIFGALTDFQYKEEFKMTYNEESKKYEATVLLKQGFYNYCYLAKYDHQEAGDPQVTEGSHFETENDYTMIAYYTDFYDQYDRVIGLLQVNSAREN